MMGKVVYLVNCIVFIGSFIDSYLLTDREVITGNSQTEALSLGQYQGQGLRFPCYDRMDQVNKFFVVWLCCGKKKKKKKRTVMYREGDLFFLSRIIELIL